MSYKQDLLGFVESSRDKGFSDAEIKKSLKEAGWEYSDVERLFEAASKDKRNLLHMHLFHRHVPLGISVTVLLLVVAGLTLWLSWQFRGEINATKVYIVSGEGAKTEFVYGSSPSFTNADYFQKVKQSFVSEKADFIEADLSNMAIRVYKGGVVAKEAQIISKGKPGSWWETPAGLYKVEGKYKNHFSSFGKVYLPWSMPFQGNFFIHGWPQYENGEPVPPGYSGGCIRLSDKDAKEIYDLSAVGMPVLVFEDSFNQISKENATSYRLKGPAVGAQEFIAADLQNNFVFTESNSGEERSIASIAKLMAALTAVEYINVEKDVTITSQMIASTSIQRLKPGDEFSVLDLLSLTLLESSNEAAKAITAPLGESRFLTLMNNKAKAIGMQNSHFVDTSGVKADNISTVADLFVLAKYLYFNRSFVLQMTMGKENRAAYGKSAFQNLQNFNKIPELQGMVGGKTGLSSAAGDSMFTVFEIEIGGVKRPIAIIALGSSDAKKDIASIYNYLKVNYEEKK